MPATLGPAVRARLRLPDTIERAALNVLTCPLEASAGAVSTTSGTITIMDAGGTEQVSAAAVTVPSGLATYSWTPASTIPLGDRWQVVWSLVTADYGTLTIRNPAMLCRVRLTCPVADSDLYSICRSLNPAGSAPISAETDHDGFIQQAWEIVQRKLLQKGKRPHLVIGGADLVDVVRYEALDLIFTDLGHRLREVYMQTAAEYREKARAAWGELRLNYDDTDSALITARRAARPAGVWLQ